MKPIAIFRHLECEGPGYLADFLVNQQIKFELIRIDRNDPIPESIDTYSALVFMGGPMSVNDDLPWIGKELKLIQQAAQQKMPVLGHCLGGQLICKALGGTVSVNKVKEIGWHKVQKLDNSIAGQWLADLPEAFDAFHWHGETFSIPDGATPLMKSQFCENQAFAVDNILALQCHVEMDAQMAIEWSREYADELSSPSLSVQSAGEIAENIDEKIRALNKVADYLYQKWLTPLLPA